MKAFRLNRLFNAKSRRCVAVALDQGLLNHGGVLSGIESLERCVRTLVAAGPDAIQFSIGQAALLQSIPGREKPALVLRSDVNNVSGSELPHALFSRTIGNAVEQAVRLDAACVAVNLFRIPGQLEITDQCIENILRLKPDCERWCMPLMIEPLTLQPNAQAGGYTIDGALDLILPIVRQAVELGADIIKADSTDDASLYHHVVKIAGRIPVLASGGGNAPDAEILARTERLIQQGAAGIVDGHNISQHKDPAGMTRALIAIVHDGATAIEAAKFITGI